MLSRLQNALVPRFVTLELSLGKRRIWWLVPLYALEQSLDFTLRVAILYWRYRERERPDWVEGLNLLCGPSRTLLRLARGECFVHIETPDVHIRIRQV